jgi:hypothetical protein
VIGNYWIDNIQDNEGNFFNDENDIGIFLINHFHEIFTSSNPDETEASC